MNQELIDTMTTMLELVNKSDYRNPKVGITFQSHSRRYTTHSYITEAMSVSGDSIEEAIREAVGYGSYSMDSVLMLENEEYRINSNGIDILNTWGKLSHIIKRDKLKEGNYVIVNHSNNSTTEVELENPKPWIHEQELLIKDHDESMEEIGEFGTYDEVEFVYIPPYHIYKVNVWDRYYDDPGCGIYDISIYVYDMATGVEA